MSLCERPAESMLHGVWTRSVLGRVYQGIGWRRSSGSNTGNGSHLDDSWDHGAVPLGLDLRVAGAAEDLVDLKRRRHGEPEPETPETRLKRLLSAAEVAGGTIFTDFDDGNTTLETVE